MYQYIKTTYGSSSSSLSQKGHMLDEHPGPGKSFSHASNLLQQKDSYSLECYNHEFPDRFKKNPSHDDSSVC